MMRLLLLTALSLIVSPVFAQNEGSTTTTTTTEQTTVAPASDATATDAATGGAAPATTPQPAPSQVGGRSMIVSPVPAAKEVIATPEGFVNCFTVDAGWYKNAWVPAHRVCQYENTPGQTVTFQGVAWIEGYWACTQFTDTNCTKWEWKPGRWVKTLEAY